MRYPIAAYQIAAAIIQKYIRGFLIRFRSTKFPPSQWQIRCVHYLSKRGPYGSLVQRQRRVSVYKLIAAIEIQTMWPTYQWHRRLGVNAERHALIIQKYWRCIICRRHYSIILGLMVDRKKLESLARKSLPGDVIIRIRGTSFPPSLSARVSSRPCRSPSVTFTNCTTTFPTVTMPTIRPISPRCASSLFPIVSSSW